MCIHGSLFFCAQGLTNTALWELFSFEHKGRDEKTWTKYTLPHAHKWSFPGISVGFQSNKRSWLISLDDLKCLFNYTVLLPTQLLCFMILKERKFQAFHGLCGLNIRNNGLKLIFKLCVRTSLSTTLWTGTQPLRSHITINVSFLVFFFICNFCYNNPWGSYHEGQFRHFLF